MHIGILEDDLDQQQLYRLWFGATQHSCVYFGTAKEFIEGAAKERFDLLLLDWMLPDSNGKMV